MKRNLRTVYAEETLPPALIGKWQWSVIYSADWHSEDMRLRNVSPPDQRVKQEGKRVRIWDLTECKDGDEVEERELFDRHRKWCALLSHAHFVQFIKHVCLYPSSTPTMGSIGAPGFGYGSAPAFSFDGDRECGAYLNAYVTPYCDQAEAVALIRWLEWTGSGSTQPWEEALPGLIEKIPDDVELVDSLWIEKLRKVWS